MIPSLTLWTDQAVRRRYNLKPPHPVRTARPQRVFAIQRRRWKGVGEHRGHNK
ncbi:Hypothetical protein FKW44_001136 [Caligus rogercresseyi]|uniref:Uncharacterized protein n=1 Tax=Caligus rogercresseyi TaxID=217165 RepID=A0A7T8QVE0_CALRO|nr:Hypothetical protein FKW44_001136 [Caligus rogercresseyi]